MSHENLNFLDFPLPPPQTSNGRRQRPRRRGVAPGGGRHRGDAGGGAARLRSGRELPGDVAGKVSHWEGLIFFYLVDFMVIFDG